MLDFATAFRRLISSIGSITLFGLVSASGTGCATDEKAELGEQEVFFQKQNQTLVDNLRSRGISAERVLRALSATPRHNFVIDEFIASSYEDSALPIGVGQTISQPYVVAFMSEALALKETDRVLEIGTGSGYQAGVLARLAKEVYSIEIIPELSKRAEKNLAAINVTNVHFRIGDGYKGWPEEAPFDAIILTAAPPEIPEALVKQLRVGGRLVAPVGEGDFQWLVRITKKTDGKVEQERMIPVRFVPMVPDRKEGR